MRAADIASEALFEGLDVRTQNKAGFAKHVIERLGQGRAQHLVLPSQIQPRNRCVHDVRHPFLLSSALARIIHHRGTEAQRISTKKINYDEFLTRNSEHSVCLLCASVSLWFWPSFPLIIRFGSISGCSTASGRRQRRFQ